MSHSARAKMQGIGAFGAALFGAAVVAASAFGFVTVYSNSFDSKREYKEVTRVGGNGKACQREWVENREIMRVTLQKAPAACTYEPPVQGDGPQPDHRYDVDGRVMKDTDKNVREDAYISLSLRVGGGKRYELRVYPKNSHYELRRQPNAAGFPSQGNDGAIKKLGGLNKMRLHAAGNRIRAFVNGTEVADVVDASAGQLEGAKLEFTLGNDGDSRKNTVGVFDKVKVAVPDP